MKRNVLITGCTSGMGYEWSRKFGSEGYNLILVGRNKEKLEKQKRELEAFKVKVEVICEEIENIDGANKVYNFLKDRNLNVDILINNAGFNESGEFIDTNLISERRLMSLHIIFLTELTKLILPGMISRNYGRILNVGSTGSYIPTPLDAVYSASKSYILSFSKAIRYELKETGVKVTTLCPGATKTEFSKKANMENTLLFSFFVMSSKRVVEKSYSKFIKGKKVIIPGIYNKLLVLSSKIFPEAIINYLSVKMLVKKR